MKMLPVALVGLLPLSACEYESPLATEQDIPIDSAVLGLWQPNIDGVDAAESEERMMVLKYSETEYLIHYPTTDNGLYYRGYPITVGDTSCVQLQVIGTENGPPRADQANLYTVIAYELKDGHLVIRTLNSDLVTDDLKTTEALREAFLKHQGNPELFEEPAVFRRPE